MVTTVPLVKKDVPGDIREARSHNIRNSKSIREKKFCLISGTLSLLCFAKRAPAYAMVCNAALLSVNRIEPRFNLFMNTRKLVR